MKIVHYISLGHYNWLNPSEMQTRIWLAIYDESNELIIEFSVLLPSEDYEYYKEKMSENPLDTFKEAVNRWLDDTWISPDIEKAKKILNFIDSNYIELKRSWIKQKLVELDEEILRIESIKTELIDELNELNGG